MQQFSKWGFGFSFLAHSALVLLLAYRAPPEKVGNKKPVEWVHFQGVKKNKRHSKKQKTLSTKSKKNKLSSQNRHSGKKSHFNYGAFSPTPYHQGSVDEHLSQEQNNEWAGNAVMETMSGMGLSEYSENFYFFEVLVNHLNNMIPYPEEISQHRITGKVWFKVLINRKGQLIQILDFSGTQPVLRAYILINIYQALKKQLPTKYWYSKDKNLALQLNFDYSVSSVPTVQPIQSGRYFKNRFEFTRLAKVENIINEKLEEYARYIPPIAPTPLGPIVDFVRLYQLIEAWRGDDPHLKKKNREKFTRERIQRLLEKAEREHRI